LLYRFPWILETGEVSWIYVPALVARKLEVREIGSGRHSSVDVEQQAVVDWLTGLQRKNELKADCVQDDAAVLARGC
jgi:hypothetical protein